MNNRSGVTAVRKGRPPGEHPLVALLIAGEPVEAEHYVRKLRLDGYAVVSAGWLERGLELARNSRPDLIFVCLGSWAVPALVLLVLRSDPATSGVPIVLVSDFSRAQLAPEVGGLLSTEQVVVRGSDVHLARERPAVGRAGTRGHRPSWDHWLPPARCPNE